MKKLMTTIIALTLSILFISTAQARNTRYLLPINAALSSSEMAGKLDGSVKFYFGNQRHPRVLQDVGVYVVNPKTNSIGKSDLRACNWVFLSALVALQKHAKEAGANAVINTVSYYKKNEMSSATQYECHAGAMMAGVALKGDLVKVAR